MSTWLNRGASGGPCGELEEEGSEPESIRLTPTGLHESRGGSLGLSAVHANNVASSLQAGLLAHARETSPLALERQHPRAGHVARFGCLNRFLISRGAHRAVWLRR